MNIGFVVGKFPTLSETFVISQMAGLMERGFNIGIICDKVVDYPHADRDKEPLSALMKNAWNWWGPAEKLRPAIECLPNGPRDKVSVGLDVAFSRKIEKFDAIIAHFGQNGARIARIKKRRQIRAPLITIFHGYDVGIPLKQGRLNQYDDLFRRGELCLTVNDYFRERLCEAGADPAKTEVHRMGIDISSIPYCRSERSCTAIKFISVCRLTEKKGIEYSLRAFALLEGERDWSYTIIGDGPLLSELTALAHELGIAEKVTFLGSRAHGDVKEQLARADVFILPSITAKDGDLEGIPVALMEAMAAGLTVVSSYHSGIPELIESERTGLLAPEKDVFRLSQHIRHVIDHPDHCDLMARAARQTIEHDFNNRLLNDQLAVRIKTLCAQREN
uniref:glycosyltransferase n=1 Tax=Paracoccus sp. T5 TaxID=3402161 RepID=UPI003AE4FE5E